MSCSPFDLKDYFLKELPDPQARLVEAHARTCPSCREELERLRLTEAALFALREEEIPQRIAFVSDPVFEPPAWRRWLAAFWGSPSRLGFASAAMLSASILVFALTRPAARLAGPPPVQPPPPAVAASISPADVQARIQAAVEKAVRESEARQAERTQKLVASFLERDRENEKRLKMASDLVQWNERRNGYLKTAAYRAGSEAGGPQ